jgi:hypothetical protein
MKVRRIIEKTLRGRSGEAVGHVHAAIAANVNEPGSSHTHVSSRQRIVQRSGRTTVRDEESPKQE